MNEIQFQATNMDQIQRLKISTVIFLCIVFGRPAAAVDLPLAVAEMQRSEPVDFAKEIMPILKRNCLACHHEKEAEGGLVLESSESIHKGGDSGKAPEYGERRQGSPCHGVWFDGCWNVCFTLGDGVLLVGGSFGYCVRTNENTTLFKIHRF